MKNTIRRYAQEEAGINITPMMDVVFIMLIFFIVSTSFVKESGIGISRTNSTEQPNKDSKIATIKLDIAGHSINGENVSINGIEARLSQLKAANPALKAQLFSAKEIDIATLVRAVEQVKEVDINGLSVSTY